MGYMMSVCFIIGDVKLDHPIQVVSARFLQYKVTIFPFVINTYLVGRYFETMQTSCFSSYFCPLILATMDDACLQLLLWYLLNDNFLFPSSLLYLLTGILLEE